MIGYTSYTWCLNIYYKYFCVSFVEFCKYFCCLTLMLASVIASTFLLYIFCNWLICIYYWIDIQTWGLTVCGHRSWSCVCFSLAVYRYVHFLLYTLLSMQWAGFYSYFCFIFNQVNKCTGHNTLDFYCPSSNAMFS